MCIKQQDDPIHTLCKPAQHCWEKSVSKRVEVAKGLFGVHCEGISRDDAFHLSVHEGSEAVCGWLWSYSAAKEILFYEIPDTDPSPTPWVYCRTLHLRSTGNETCPRWTQGPGCSRECDCVQEHSLAATPKQEAVSVRPPTTDHKCEPGFFGAGCEQPCDCPGGGSCDPRTGECSQRCPAGLHGEKCQLACPSLRYGESCRLTCGCGGAPCDPVTGRCICPAGKTGDSCHEDCPDAFWGMKCQSACPDCENGASCNKESGVCDCRPGFMGNLCQNACESGYWGPGCVNTCECREISEGCDPVSGQCVCEAGFTGDHCEKKCVNGSFGRGCVLPCRCESGALCDHVSGACTCSPGYAGTYCEKTASSNHGMFYLGPQCARTAFTVLTVARCVSAGTVPAATTSQEAACAPPAGQDHTAFWVMEATSLKRVRPVSVSGGPGVTTSAGVQLCSRLDWTCPAGYYGEQCSGQCLCGNGGSCDSVSGQCSCPPAGEELPVSQSVRKDGLERTAVRPAAVRVEGGVTERQEDTLMLFLIVCVLSEACSEGFFGERCEQRCDCVHSPSCHHVTGLCECEPGWRGARCDKHCLPGSHGASCAQPCDCQAGVSCHHETGSCGCPAGLMGPGCETPCPAGVFGMNCSQLCRCSGDQEQCHPVTGKCSCLPGYYGARCELRKNTDDFLLSEWTRCRAGTFGPNCKSRCSCTSGGRCDFRTGTCYCPAGFIGADCSLRCPSGYYGKDCAKMCSCGEGGQCHPATGKCICAPGRMGQSCQQACPRGRYGLQCRNTCSCQNGGLCDPIHGSCRCGLGWTGARCDSACSQGKYGFDCAQDCPCLNNGTCDRFTGSCGCSAGYYGHSCCPSGFFGVKCARTCDCKAGRTCDHVTGKCVCPPGYHGPQCERRCESGRFGLSCGESCDCAGEAPCDPSTGRCLCPPGRTGQRCEKARNVPFIHFLSFTIFVLKTLPPFSVSDCGGERFGPDCSLPCQCSHRARCEGLSGRCLCPLTWLGPTCTEGKPLSDFVVAATPNPGTVELFSVPKKEKSGQQNHITKAEVQTPDWTSRHGARLYHLGEGDVSCETGTQLSETGTPSLSLELGPGIEKHTPTRLLCAETFTSCHLLLVANQR
ncbi:hypothetical protein F7725_021059 [Dissostichus mawsoni]|uniref:EGF-like domain-containing protein n=1 Tax=Dissostichus mawsoni TaxID=36200 RepID=A0A7J5YGA8_DISMA|nr:hypothetical protein F7725_021059 [Dissostichus mawsoni]